MTTRLESLERLFALCWRLLVVFGLAIFAHDLWPFERDLGPVILVSIAGGAWIKAVWDRLYDTTPSI